MHELKHYIEAFTSLHTAKVKGHRAPHKAVLLLAVIDLMEEGEITSPSIELSDNLDRKFNAIWRRYLGESSIFTPDITKPFFHMQHEAFWKLVEHEETALVMVAEPSPFVGSSKETKDLPVGGYSIKAMRRAFAYAEIDQLLFSQLRNADARAMLRVVLINTYLSNQPTKSLPNLTQLMMALPILALVA